MIGFALVLFLGIAACWIAAQGTPPQTRLFLRIAAFVYAVMAAGEVAAPGLLRDGAMSLGSALLCLAAWSAFRKPLHWLAFITVLFTTASAIVFAANLRQVVFAVVPQALSIAVMLFIARPGTAQRSSIYLALASLMLLGAAACALTPNANLMAQAGLLLFTAAGVAGVGLASNFLVEERGDDRRPLAIRRAR